MEKKQKSFILMYLTLEEKRVESKDDLNEEKDYFCISYKEDMYKLTQ